MAILPSRSGASSLVISATLAGGIERKTTSERRHASAFATNSSRGERDPITTS